MYKSDIAHFLDEEGNIPEEMPEEGKSVAEYLTLLIEAASNNFPEEICASDYRCPECHSYIITRLKDRNEDIYWFCGDCENEGVIINWKGTKWNIFEIYRKNKSLISVYFDFNSLV